jgi:peptidase S46-like protein
MTIAQLAYERDRGLPTRLGSVYRQEVNLTSYASCALENARRTRDELLGVQNDRKRYIGLLEGLQDPELFGKLVSRENEFRSVLGRSAEFRGPALAYDRIENAQVVLAENAQLFNLLEGFPQRPTDFDGDLFRIARSLVRSAAEREKPDGERLPEFQDSNQSSFELALLSEAPIYDDLEIVQLSSSLTEFASQMIR